MMRAKPNLLDEVIGFFKGLDLLTAEQADHFKGLWVVDAMRGVLAVLQKQDVLTLKEASDLRDDLEKWAYGRISQSDKNALRDKVFDIMSESCSRRKHRATQSIQLTRTASDTWPAVKLIKEKG